MNECESSDPPTAQLYRKAALRSPIMDQRFIPQTEDSYGGVDATSDCHLSDQRGRCANDSIIAPQTSTTAAAFPLNLNTNKHKSQGHSLGAWHCMPRQEIYGVWRHSYSSTPPFLLPNAAILHLRPTSSPVMARAVVWSPLQGSYGARTRISWKGEVSCSRQDFFLNKCNLSVKSLQPTRSPSGGSSATRSSLDSASTYDFQGRYASGYFDPPCALCCPVNRDTYIQRWLEESVHEIVRNIQEAPFLQYVFDSQGRLGRSHRHKISKELLKNPDHWTGSPLRESLSKVDPDGIILVQKLEPGCPSAYCLAEAFQWGKEESEMVCPLQGEGAETNVWGVLVQARGVHANACYLLKTTRVSSSAGICTRYCLTRAKCFGPSYVHQIENAWLL